MRQYIYIIVCLFSSFYCKGQKETIEYERKNLVIFNFIDDGVEFCQDKHPLSYMLTHNKLIFLKDNRYIDFRHPMQLSFHKGIDTMSVTLIYQNYGNIYVDNFKFEKGSYQLIINVNNYQEYLLKKQDIPKQKIISKNNYVYGERKRKNIELKNLIFYKVNLNDTNNAKLIKTE
ncbi:MAG: hypothetical protein ACK5IQ_04460 [Bacteroidales bacterium]